MKVYPPKPEGGALTETDPVGPSSIYGATKVAAEYACTAAFRTQGLPAIVLRLFFQLGPRQAERFATARLAAEIVRIERGEAEPVVRVGGNPGIARDYTDVRDIARAYRLAAVKGEPGETYNVASGRATRAGEIVETLRKLAKKDFRTEARESKKKSGTSGPPAAPGAVTGDFSKFRKATGWEPVIPLERTLAELLEHYRAKLAR